MDFYDEIAVGEIFVMEGGSAYMKIAPVGLYDCIQLKTGILCTWPRYNDIPVQKLSTWEDCFPFGFDIVR